MGIPSPQAVPTCGVPILRIGAPFVLLFLLLAPVFGAEKTDYSLPSGYYLEQDKKNNQWRACDGKGNCFEARPTRELAVYDAFVADVLNDKKPKWERVK